MQFSEADLIKIVEKASNLNERLSGNFISDPVANNEAIIKDRLARWCRVVAGGNKEKFAQRLERDNLDLTKISQLVGSVRLKERENLPAWTQTLSKGIQGTKFICRDNLERGVLALQNPSLNPLKPLPFEEIWLSFVNVARNELILRAQPSPNVDLYSLLSPETHGTLERGLIEYLCYTGAQALATRFKLFQHQREPALIRTLGKITASRSNEQYKLFVEEMLDRDLVEFLLDYPVLARLAATATDFWVEAVGEFLQRLASDKLAIEKTFNSGKELGQVVAIQANLADRHRQGRSVMALQFASGLKLVYKPKDLGTEVAYNQLLSWLNERAIPLDLKALQVISRDNYGWVEYVEHLPCQNQTEAQNYYKCTGMFLCLAYVLKGTDFLDDNIIAHGQYPVAIDIEMLFNHQVRTAQNQSQGAKDVYSLAYEQMYDSVLDTGFLPRWLFVATGQSMDISGLGGNSGQETLFKVPQWQKINTDEMTLTYGYQKGRLGKNVPFLEGENLAVKDYVEELVAGFKTMYQFLMEHRDALLDSTSPLSNLARQKVRFTFRATKIYALLLQKSLQLELLKDGAARSIQLDFLSRAEFWSDKINHFNDCNAAGCRQLIAAEKQALEQLDIPIFTAWANSDALEIDTEEIVEGCFAEPSINIAIARLERLSAENLEQQLGFIRGSLYAHIATPADNSDLSTKLTITAQEALKPEEATKAARAIAEKLQEGAISSPNGSLTWIALTYVLQIQRLQLEPLRFSLYDGTCGIALFLAALGKVTGKTQWQSLALKTLQSLRHNLNNPQASQALANKLGIGGAVGVGSWIYALSKTSQFLDEPDLLADASKAANLITPQQLTETKEYEVVSGIAGAILGLLSLYQIHPQQSILDKAYLAGSRLLKCRTASDSGLRAWQTVNNKLLSGFSHGAAGIVYALLRLYRVTQDASFLEASLEAIAYERTIFNAKLGNWLDLRKEQPQFTNTWCHGATGIGLARLGCLSVLDTPIIQEDLEVALKTAQDVSWQGVDNYCCGNFGRIDLLLEAGTHLQRPELIAAAQKQAAWVVARAQQTGFYQVFNNVPRDTYSPGLFTGISGIGYGLLRLSHPQLLPSVLLWQ